MAQDFCTVQQMIRDRVRKEILTGEHVEKYNQTQCQADNFGITETFKSGVTIKKV